MAIEQYTRFTDSLAMGFCGITAPSHNRATWRLFTDRIAREGRMEIAGTNVRPRDTELNGAWMPLDSISIAERSAHAAPTGLKVAILCGDDLRGRDSWTSVARLHKARLPNL